jgi:hypothetical protein
LSAGLGGLAGAAVASPLVFVDPKVSATRNRLWLSSIALGTFVGAGIGLFTTAHGDTGREAQNGPTIAPYGGVIAVTETRGGGAVPATGVGVQGTF